MIEIKNKLKWLRVGWGTEEGEEILRFRLRPNEEREIVFLSEDPICIWQHSVFYNNRWRVYTCREALGRCPLCEAGIKRFFVRIFPIIDVTGFVGRDGTRHNVGRLYLFPARQNTSAKLRRLFSREPLPEGKLRKYRVSRSEGRQVPAVGDNFEFIGFVDKSLYSSSPNYFSQEWQEKILKAIEPLSEEELQKIAGAKVESQSSVESEEDKPF